MRLVGIDAETYYCTASKFSLSSMGAEEYIRDPRFHEIGWAAQVRGDSVGPAAWRDARDWDSMHQFLLDLRLDEAGTVTVAHNGAGFDFMVIAWLHGIHPWRQVDTLQMSRWLYGKFGPSGKGNSLKQLAEDFGLEAKGDEVIYANGKRLQDFTPVELAQYGRYCVGDVRICLDIFERLAPEFRPDDFTTMHLLSQMSSNPRVLIDAEVVAEGLEAELTRKSTMLQDVARMVGTDTDKLKSAVMSNPKFAQIIEALGYDVPMKESKTTGKLTFAFAKTDPEMQEWAESEDELLANLVRLRVGIKSTIMESRLKGYLAMADRGPAPAALRWQGTVTGRANADGGIHKLQFHNTPKRALGARNPLRLSMGSTAGWWYAADSSQIEVRVLADLAGEEVLLRNFRKAAKARTKQLLAHFGGDPEEAARYGKLVEAADLYLGLGPALFGRAITKADKFERNVNKAAILAGGFGQGWRGFKSHCQRNGIEITDELAERTISAYRDAHRAIVALWKECRAGVDALCGLSGDITIGADANIHVSKEQIILPSGRTLFYPKAALRRDEKRDEEVFSYRDRFTGKWKYMWHGVVVENCVQATAYDTLAWQAAQILKHEGHAMTLFVHDELAYTDEPGKEEYWEQVLTKWMRTAPPYLPNLVLDCEFGHGPTYADV